MRSIAAARSPGAMRLQSPRLNAARAAWTARSASCALASATVAIGSPVAGSMTVRVRSVATSSPSMSSACVALSVMATAGCSPPDTGTPSRTTGPSRLAGAVAMDTAARLGRQCVTVRMLTVADVLELPVVRRGLPDVVAGAAGLGRELRWAHVIELPDPADLLKGGELVLTTGMGAGERAAAQRAWVSSLIEQGAAAIAVELGHT